MNYLKFIKALLFTNFKASFRSEGFYHADDLHDDQQSDLFLVWWILFQRFDDINGWGISDVQAFGIGAGSFGIAVIVGGGTRFLAKK